MNKGYDLMRLMRPRSVAVIGGGAWCAQVIVQSRRMGYEGDIWPVYPKGGEVAGIRAFASLDDLPGPPDAAFVGINRDATIEAVHHLSDMRAGGAVCFASGFGEAVAEDARGGDLQARLVAAAGDMPILGPNCYGFINALDGALLWPDQHGAERVARGVAILTQSSNIAINLTMQSRVLPIAYMVTCGNMAQTGQARIASALLDDPRVTALGLHIEGFGDLRDWEALARKAYEKGVPIVALKVGASAQAQKATISHTASLAGSDAGAQALLTRLGIARLHDLPAFLETLKLLHCGGPLPGGRIASISCSGGEASLIADMAEGTGLCFPDLSARQQTHLRAALGTQVALSNPLDYHTYIWRNEDAMVRTWEGMVGDEVDITLSIVDYPRTDASDWTCTTRTALAVRAKTGARFGMVSSLPELMPEDVARDLMAGGVVPFSGLREALAAIRAAGQTGAPAHELLCLPVPTKTPPRLLGEAEAKAELAAYGLKVPRGAVISPKDKTPEGMTAPFAVKGLGLAHKSEEGAVILRVMPEDLKQAMARIGTDEILVEEMIFGGVAELLVGVLRDPAHGFVLTLGAGGIWTEILRDTRSLLVPASGDAIRAALEDLRIAPVLQGYRGASHADMDSIIKAIMAVQAYVIDNAPGLHEVEINPLICTATTAVAADALIRKERI